MADVNVVVVTTPKPNEPSDAFAPTAVSANSKAVIPIGRDEQTTFIATATGACNLTIKAGDGLQAVNDEVIAIEAGKYVAFSLDSGRFKNLRGDYAGCVVIVPSAACSLMVVETRV